MTVTSLTRGRTVRVGALGACAALALLVSVGGAQTPSSGTPSSDQATGDGPHPAHTHSGTCDQLGDVVVTLTNLVDPTVEGERVGPASAHPVKTSRTDVELPLQEIIDGGHAINVHLSDEEIGEYIACGDVGGVVTTEDGSEHLRIGLGELNDSGHAGVAWLGTDGDGTDVVVNLIEPDELD